MAVMQMDDAAPDALLTHWASDRLEHGCAPRANPCTFASLPALTHDCLHVHKHICDTVAARRHFACLAARQWSLDWLSIDIGHAALVPAAAAGTARHPCKLVANGSFPTTLNINLEQRRELPGALACKGFRPPLASSSPAAGTDRSAVRPIRSVCTDRDRHGRNAHRPALRPCGSRLPFVGRHAHDQHGRGPLPRLLPTRAIFGGPGGCSDCHWRDGAARALAAAQPAECCAARAVPGGARAWQPGEPHPLAGVRCCACATGKAMQLLCRRLADGVCVRRTWLGARTWCCSSFPACRGSP